MSTVHDLSTAGLPDASVQPRGTAEPVEQCDQESRNSPSPGPPLLDPNLHVINGAIRDAIQRSMEPINTTLGSLNKNFERFVEQQQPFSTPSAPPPLKRSRPDTGAHSSASKELLPPRIVFSAPGSKRAAGNVPPSHLELGTYTVPPSPLGLGAPSQAVSVPPSPLQGLGTSHHVDLGFSDEEDAGHLSLVDSEEE